jgi:hypothetical protein
MNVWCRECLRIVTNARDFPRDCSITKCFHKLAGVTPDVSSGVDDAVTERAFRQRGVDKE